MRFWYSQGELTVPGVFTKSVKLFENSCAMVSYSEVHIPSIQANHSSQQDTMQDGNQGSAPETLTSNTLLIKSMDARSSMNFFLQVSGCTIPHSSAGGIGELSGHHL